MNRSRIGLRGRDLIVLGLVSGLAVLATTRHGVGIDADSVAYVDIARHLRAGDGFALSPGLTTAADPYKLRATAHFPPLYPVVLAFGEAAGLDAWTVARWLGAALAALSAVLLGVVVRDAGASRVQELAVCGLTVTAVDWLRIHTWALSEPVFLACLVAAVGALARQLRTPSPCWLGLAAGATAGAALTRYTGLALIGTGVIALLTWTPRPWRERGRDVAVFLAVAGLPLAAWHARGVLVGAPGRPVVVHPLTLDRLRQGLDSISAWLLPETLPLMVRAVVLGVVVIGLGILWRRVPSVPPARALTRVVATFGACYAALLLVTISIIYANVPLDARLLVPLLVAAMLVGWRVATASGRGRRALIVACSALAAIATVRAVVWVTVAEVEDLGYASRVWRQSVLVAAVRDVPADVVIVSNAPDALYVRTGRRAWLLPARVDPFTRAARAEYPSAVAALDAAMAPHGGALVYFRWLHWRWYLASERDLVTAWSMKALVEARGEGAFYVRGPH